MYMGITLSRLGDFKSAVAALEKALQIEPNDCMTYLNYAAVLLNNGKEAEAREKFKKSEAIYQTIASDMQDPEVMDARAIIASALNITLKDK
jgi:Flp pilus assembly protein TadD